MRASALGAFPYEVDPGLGLPIRGCRPGVLGALAIFSLSDGIVKDEARRDGWVPGARNYTT